MKITVIGTGYVGLVTGTCFAEVGMDVTCVDIDQKKVENLNKGICPFMSPAGRNGNAQHAKNVFIFQHHCRIAWMMWKWRLLPWHPADEDGSADLKYVLSGCFRYRQIHEQTFGSCYKIHGTGYHAEKVRKAVQVELEKRGSKLNLCGFQPEFLKEGAAIE